LETFEVGMKKLHRSWVAVAAAALLVACSGGGEGDQSPRVSYGKLVTFGDSLSDVGTYGVGIVASFGGGKYTINGNELSLNWTELLAKTIDVADLCPAQTGLNSAVELGGPIPTQNFDSCYSYAQGGARVTDPIGPGNRAVDGLRRPFGHAGPADRPGGEPDHPPPGQAQRGQCLCRR
jgi:outer membrane lipase/esterase